MQNAKLYIPHLLLVLALIFAGSTYALGGFHPTPDKTPTLSERAEIENKQSLRECQENIDYSGGTTKKIIKALNDCADLELIEVKIPTGKTTSGTLTAGTKADPGQGIAHTSASLATSELIKKVKKHINYAQSVKKKETQTYQKEEMSAPIANISKPPSTNSSLKSSPTSAPIVAYNTDAKYWKVYQNLGYREAPTQALLNACQKAKDPNHCTLIGLTILYNESGKNQNSNACIKRFNCMGIRAGNFSYKNYQHSMDVWVGIYNRVWYKAKSASFFYSPKGSLPPSRYCTSEASSRSLVGCPNGLAIASKKWVEVEKILFSKP